MFEFGSRLKWFSYDMPMDLNTFIKFSESLECRETVCRFFEFFGHYLEWEFRRQGNKQRAQDAVTMYEKIGTARKVYRFLKALEYFKGLNMISHSDPVYRRLMYLAQANCIFFFGTDHISFLGDIGLLRGTGITSEEMDKWTVRSWLLMCFLGILMPCYKLWKGDVKSPGERHQLFRELVKNVADSIIAGEILGVYKDIGGISFHKGITGLAGSLTSVMQCQEAWWRLNGKSLV